MLSYEDNFGFWDIHGSEEQAFFDYVRRQSVLIACERCERPVPLIPPQSPLRFLCLRARIWGTDFDKRIWQSGNAFGLCSPVVKGAFFPSSAALCVATLSQNERTAAQGSSSQ